jgi:hypothetical protein
MADMNETKDRTAIHLFPNQTPHPPMIPSLSKHPQPQPQTMAPQEIDLEKQPLYNETEISSPTSPSRPKDTTNRQSQLNIYQALVGDVYAKPTPGLLDDSLYHEVVTRERFAKRHYMVSAFAFGLCVLAQIVLCLGITVGSQLGLKMYQITILAAVNTGVAAAIAVLKGLGLPEKKGVEKHKLEKIAEKIRFTTRKLKAGLTIDAVKEAEDAVKQHEDVEDEAQVVMNAGDAASYLPSPKSPQGPDQGQAQAQ